ncbi:unnamed protein product [Toxocara canis]|uniref:Uncharacterized protein n=1 Tax=Toxocara canis TaxID=6265 RepID=A0A183U7G8_TOXCA|nr:unnamed protein product [Toxocara canis]
MASFRSGCCFKAYSDNEIITSIFLSHSFAPLIRIICISDSNSVDVDNGMKKFGRGGDKRTRVWVNREKGESETESGLYWTRGTHVKRYSQQRKTIEHYGGQERESGMRNSAIELLPNKPNGVSGGDWD